MHTYDKNYQNKKNMERNYYLNKISKKNQTNIKQDYGLIIIGALIFTASFLWKDLFSDIQNTFFPTNNGFGYRILYVIMVTIILVFIAVELRNRLGLKNMPNVIQFDDNPLDN